jgi:hypothetical protein
LVRERIGLCRQSTATRRKNLEFLQRLADDILEEHKAIPYAILLDPRWPAECQRIVDGVPISWNVEIQTTGSNGDICVDIEFYSDLPTTCGAKPARRFWKRPDETIIST